MSAGFRQSILAVLWLSPLMAPAQTAPAPASSTGMDMMAMPDMVPQPSGHAGQAGPHAHAAPSPGRTAAAEGSPKLGPIAPGPARKHAMQGMPMPGSTAPPAARSSDYSAGIGHGDAAGMDMLDAEPLGMLRFDQLEAFHGPHGNGEAWEAQGWYGTDSDKLWLRSEGEREGGHTGDGDVEVLWSRAVAAYWDAQLGMRHDFGGGRSGQWLAFGVQGLAPYWFELAATAYAGPSGRTAARLRAEYELLFTQRLILQPELELNLYGKADPQRRTGAGLSDASLGLRLRYEIRRGFAPYLGVNWIRRFGASAGYARADGKPVSGPQWVAGVRFWF